MKMARASAEDIDGMCNCLHVATLAECVDQLRNVISTLYSIMAQSHDFNGADSSNKMTLEM